MATINDGVGGGNGVTRLGLPRITHPSLIACRSDFFKRTRGLPTGPPRANVPPVAAWTFIRHGQSVANAQGWFAGHRDAPLTEHGRQQAEAARLAAQDIAFDGALCSDLCRAHDTARTILRGRDVPLTVTPALRERTCGTWEGRDIAELETDGAIAAFTGWQTRPGDGESLRDVAARVCRFFAERPEVGSTLVVSHGALMRAVIGSVDGIPEDQIGAWRPANCELVRRDVSGARWRALADALEG